ncbi:MAG TPA: HAD hydrolase-like protein [Candidatus Saccharimonadales bacterium]|jgi:phosphoglycolate phosphatase
MAAKSRGGTRGRRQAVIFDFDGTIADSFDYVFDFLKKEAGDTANYPAKQLREFRKMSMKRLALHLGVPVWRMPVLYFKGRRVMRAHMENVEPFSGMVDVIRTLYQDGYLLLIASSNSSHNIRHLLRRQGILSCFRAVRSSAGLTGKPGLIRQLLVRYRLSRQHVWYVGDELGDVTAAARAGVRSLAVGWGFADPEQLKALEPGAFAEKPADIVRIIENSWKK